MIRATVKAPAQRTKSAGLGRVQQSGQQCGSQRLLALPASVWAEPDQCVLSLQFLDYKLEIQGISVNNR